MIKRVTDADAAYYQVFDGEAIVGMVQEYNTETKVATSLLLKMVRLFTANFIYQTQD